MKSPLILIAGLVCVSPLAAQDERPPTVNVAPKVLVVVIDGRSRAEVTPGWPATVQARLSPAIQPGSLHLTLRDASGQPHTWPWKEALEIKMATSTLKYWTLSSADTGSLATGEYTLTIDGRLPRKSVRSELSFTVRAAPAQVDALEQVENELTYFRAIGDRASAVTAAENALKLSPADPAKALDYGRALLDAGRAEEALAIGQKALDQLPSGKGEPPGAFVRLVRDARAQVIAKAMANEKPGT